MENKNEVKDSCLVYAVYVNNTAYKMLKHYCIDKDVRRYKDVLHKAFEFFWQNHKDKDFIDKLRLQKEAILDTKKYRFLGTIVLEGHIIDTIKHYSVELEVTNRNILSLLVGHFIKSN